MKSSGRTGRLSRSLWEDRRLTSLSPVSRLTNHITAFT